MFTAKDALYQSMAYTDKKTGESPSPTPSNEPLIITLQFEEYDEEGTGSGNRLCDVSFNDVVSAIESNRTVYCVCKLFAPDPYYYLNYKNNALWPVECVGRDENNNITDITFRQICLGNGDVIIYEAYYTSTDINATAYQLIPQ